MALRTNHCAWLSVGIDIRNPLLNLANSISDIYYPNPILPMNFYIPVTAAMGDVRFFHLWRFANIDKHIWLNAYCVDCFTVQF